MEISRKLQKSSLGAELSDQQAEVLAGIGATIALAEGQYLIEEGASDESLHVLLDGKLEVVKKAGMGDEITLHVLREGDLAGQMSFVDPGEHTLGLRALCACSVFSLQRSDFESLITREPQLVYKVMCAIMRSAHRIVHHMNLQHIELSNYVYKQHGRY